MASKQRIVYGAAVKWGTDGTTYVAIPEVEGLAVPEISPEYIDVTSLDSAGGYREYISGLKDAGEITVPAGYTSDLYDDAFGYMTDGTLIYFETTLPPETGQAAGDVFEFTGLVNPKLQTNAVGEPIKIDLVIRLSGAPTYTKGAAS